MNFSISNRSNARNLTMNTNFDVLLELLEFWSCASGVVVVVVVVVLELLLLLFVCLFVFSFFFFHYLMSSSKLSPSPFFHCCSPTCFSLWESNRWPLNDFMSSAKFEAELDASETHRTQENKVKWIQWAHTWFVNSGFCILTLYCQWRIWLKPEGFKIDFLMWDNWQQLHIGDATCLFMACKLVITKLPWLCFKATPSAKPFIWKLVPCTCKWTTISMWINLISYENLSTRTRKQLGNHLVTWCPLTYSCCE